MSKPSSLSRIASRFSDPRSLSKAVEEQKAARQSQALSAEPAQTIAIAATFTAEPIEEPLAFWMSQVGMPAQIQFAPYNQVFQELVDPGSLLSKNSEGLNVLLLRMEDWQKTGSEAGVERQELERKMRELAAALQAAAQRSKVPFFLCMCPPSKAVLSDPQAATFFQGLEAMLAAQLSGAQGVHVTSSEQLFRLYPVENYQDEFALTVGAIPYVPALYTALATILTRRFHALRTAPAKVIVLDCDHTLWKGVCGEDGPLGVEIDEPRRQLQEFMIAQYEAGMILCLCSKNAPEDVQAVFDANAGMRLQNRHILTSRINWHPKSQNLKELAEELQLGVDSFIFVDDNPLECAEVRANCPEAQILELPANPREIPSTIGHFWAFDHWKTTKEDLKRTDLYRQNYERESVRKEAASLDEFLRELKLVVDIRPMRPDDVARVSQLTERTNQFNCSTVRRSESEIQQFCESGGTCLVCEVSDRFGEYGLVSVVLYRETGDAISVDTMLMSCRAMGRRVEHQILRQLGLIAGEERLEFVEIRYIPTKKNQPALDFLDSVAAQFANADGEQRVYRIPAVAACSAPDVARSERPEPAPKEGGSRSTVSAPKRAGSDLLSRIASSLRTTDEIAYAIESQKTKAAGSSGAYAGPRTTTEEILTGLWCRVLRAEQVSIHDNFFALGGHSLRAVQVIARVREVLNVELPLRAIFEAPTVSELAERIDQSRRARSGLTLPPLQSTSRDGRLPVSFAQQRLWFIDQLEPGNAIYNVPLAIRIEGALNSAVLEKSLHEIVRRHEVFRTVFESVDGYPAAAIQPDLRPKLDLTDISFLEQEQREPELDRLLHEEAARPFDLAAGPLLRAKLVRVETEKHLLLLTMHHIVSDRWSFGVLAEELKALYGAFGNGQPSPLTDLGIQYSDFAAWQRSWLQGEILEKQLAYWKSQLSGAPAVLELPADHQRPAVLGHRGAIRAHFLPKDLLDKLVALSHAEGVTLFMTLLAAFQTLLSRYSGQNDVVVGTPIAGRNYTEVEPLIGFFVNTLALRGDLSGEPTFRQLLARTKGVTLDAYAHQDIPFEKLVEELQPERSLSYNPIFQVLFALQNAPMQPFELSGLQVERLAIDWGIAAFDFSCFAMHVDGGLLLRAEYNTDLFEEASIGRLLGHFQKLLEGIAAHPETRISELPLLGDAERRQILVDFNQTRLEHPENDLLHDFVARQAERRPDAEAVVAGTHRITYRELNERANQVAHYLNGRGHGPDVPIGLCCERSADLLVGMLGILKSGSAYVPLDPNYPKERLGFILEDARCPVVLTQLSLRDELPGFSGQAICLDADWPEIAREPISNPVTTAKPDDLAYILFTSGSTGRPKGVAIEHRSAAALIHWARQAYTDQELAGVLLSTSICFDLSVFEIFVTWSNGGKIIVAENALYLPALPAKDEVTLINTVPSAMAELVRANGIPDSVRTVNLAGEPLPESLVELIYANTRVERVYNLYGPTEDTTYSTYTLVERGARVTIGRPISNSQAYILDANGAPTPIGVPGELFMAGAGLARGYYGRPDLTAERFLPNPFGESRQGRMYRTSDLCRWLPDGNIQYFGRLDHQIKLRGFRIELGEIEATLNRYPGVRQSITVVREDQPGQKLLAAYVVAEAGIQLKAAELRDHVKSILPEFMVPSAVVILPEMPLTPNGKVNRRALPVPEYGAAADASYVAPRTAIEETIAAIWASVLKVERVGAGDDFFALGGHSLIATQMISRIRQAFHVNLPLRTVFEAPVLFAFAVRVDAAQRTEREVDFPPPVRVPRDRALPLSSAQHRLWFLDQLEPNSALYNVPLAIRMSGDLHLDALEDALNGIIQRHEILRTTYVTEGDTPFQVIAPELKIEIPVVDFTDRPQEELEAAVRQFSLDMSKRPFHLKTGPLIRATLLRLRPEDHVLLLDTHHIANDGWSLWQFVEELAPRYEARIEGRSVDFPELPIQYADFAVWQHELLQRGAFDKELSYWKKQLEGIPDSLELPADRPRPANLSYRGATETAIFPRELVDKLNELSRREGVTLYMTLLAAYQALLFRYTGQDDVVVGSPIANRNRAETESLIGFFVNTLVMRTDVSGNPTFRELLQRVREATLGAYANQDLPFEKLVEALHPDRHLGRIPLFQVWFALQNAPRSAWRLPGLELSKLEVHNGTAKFDLGLFTVEKPDGLSCLVEYSTDLFDGSTIQRLLQHFRLLLEGIARDPDQRIGSHDMLTAAEVAQLRQWNATEREYPVQRGVYQFFEEQVERSPDATALVCADRRLSYREFDQQANRLAHYLRSLGVGPETLVGVYMERSIEMVLALHGTMKAGGAYIPFDPEQPVERLAAMLRDTKMAAILTQDALRSQLSEAGCPVIALDSEWALVADQPVENPAVLAGPENAAYVIFTSGSTGVPKGVMNTHAGLSNRLLWMQEAYPLDGSDAVLQKTPYSFDVSVWEFFWPFMTGARLVVAEPGGHRDPAYLARVIQDESITTIHFVPSMLQMFLEHEGVAELKSLKRVVCSGEALPFDLQQRFFEKSAAQLHNLYGPTEAAIDVTHWTCQRDGAQTVVPIGRPIANIQIHILDSFGKPVPVGVSGELHIGGIGVARGYLNRPELTRERFIPDSFRADPAARLYKTGDLARYRPDGSIEYLGRIDHQVKIRGFRIELGEIETALDSHPGVLQSVVLAREDEPGEKRLVGYVVPDPDFDGSESEQNDDALRGEQISQWTMAFDEAYRKGESVSEATFNITGWDSSYTGGPIPAEEMRVWVESTAGRMRSLKPKRVWEIGCGTGLLLFRVAPSCEQYYATDISATALDFVRAQLDRPELALPQVTLEQRPAHEFPADAKGRFDLVVLNSIIQYFPNLEYFVQVLENAVESVASGGAVLIGDVRSLPLLETFVTSVQLFRASEETSISQIRQRARKSIEQEGEFLLDPEVFAALQQRIPRMSRIEIQLKRGMAHNELTRFRYDVIVHVGNPEPKADCAWLDWKRQALSPESVREILQKTGPDLLGLAGVPNRRLQSEIAAQQMVAGEDGPANVGELRLQIQTIPSAAVEPEDLWALESDFPYQVEIRPSQTADDCCNVLLRRVTEQDRVLDTPVRFPGESDTWRPLASYANNPLRQRFAGKLIPRLRLWLGEKVPEYMIPSAFVVMDSMPLTNNGKVNRRALPAPEQPHTAESVEYLAPRTPAEEVVAAVFADVLHLERIGREDNFFELGGHSLSATQVVSRIRQTFRVELAVRVLFESPTVASLAECIVRIQRESSGLAVPAIVPAPRDRALPLSFAQQRLWVLDQLEPGNPLYNFTPTIRMTGVLNIPALERALNDLVERHEILRTTYGVENGQPVQVIASGVRVALPLVDLSGIPASVRESEAKRVVNEEAQRPFNLASDPILRPVLYRLEAHDHVLLLSSHHIASDGWSNGVLRRDLSALYRAAVEEQPASLPELTIQYADYAVWQRDWFQGEVLEKQLSYWRSRLDGAPPILELPTDRPRPAAQTFRGAVQQVKLPKALSDSVATASRQQSTTAFMTLLAAFKSLLFHYSKQPDVVLGTDIANRTTVQTEELIGFFVNLLVLRTDLSGDPTIKQLLARVRDVALGAYSHQDAPFDKLVEELRPERSMSHNPLVQVLFVQQNTPAGAVQMPGLELSGFPIEISAKFDMVVFVTERESGIHATWLYNPDLFDASTITRMTLLYKAALEFIVANPGDRLSGLLQVLADNEESQRAAEHKEYEEVSLHALRSIRRRREADT